MQAASKPFYYWRAGHPAAPGTVIQPGSWGRGLLARRSMHRRWRVEQLAEAARPPAMPSRLKVGYVFYDWPSCWSLPWSRPYIHRVSIAEQASTATVLDMSWLDVAQDALKEGSPARARAACRSYWAGERSTHQHWEVLTLSPWRVIDMVLVHRVEPGDEWTPPPPEPAWGTGPVTPEGVPPGAVATMGTVRDERRHTEEGIPWRGYLLRVAVSPDLPRDQWLPVWTALQSRADDAETRDSLAGLVADLAGAQGLAGELRAGDSDGELRAEIRPRD